MVGILEECVENCDLSLAATVAAQCLQECVNFVLDSEKHPFDRDEEHHEGLSTGLSVFIAVLLVCLAAMRQLPRKALQLLSFAV